MTPELVIVMLAGATTLLLFVVEGRRTLLAPAADAGSSRPVGG